LVAFVVRRGLTQLLHAHILELAIRKEGRKEEGTEGRKKGRKGWI
jgi:hypothetical protein